ncbi:unnamed protein product [Lactuca saligna]|uniref:Uncharacterized protein n=1 Tax=Lactuca saligna TaxID=75948 RepID=A0AA35V5K5_LACSI|nr:unnamed protein product [Lactuca saligna]
MKPEEHVLTVVIESAEPVIDELAKITIPSKFGVFRRLNKQSVGSRKSPTSSVTKTRTRQLVIQEESTEEDEVILETPKEILITKPSSPERTTVIPHEVSYAKLFHEEA